MKITFCLITLNESSNLQRCLESCQALADEIVIVDSGSTDDTEKIGEAFGVKWFHQDWLGFRDQKNMALDLASNDWVFSIDADEALSPQLITEIKAIKASQMSGKIVGFDMPRCVKYEGRWIRHGDWYPDRLVRLFLKDKGRFAGGRVHERLEIDGTLNAFRGELEHYSYTDVDDHWRRCQYYAKLWAEGKYELGTKVGPLSGVSHALFRWIRGYLLKRGYLDGAQGLRIANMCAREVSLKYSLLRQMNRSKS